MNPRLAAVVALVVLAGCSSSSKPQAATSSSTTKPPATTAPRGPASGGTAPVAIDPCDLVTQAQARALVGTELLPGLAVRADSTSDRTCTYTPPAGGPKVQVEVLVGPGAEPHGPSTDAGAIFVRNNGTWVAIRVTSDIDDTVLRSRLRALARTLSS